MSSAVRSVIGQNLHLLLWIGFMFLHHHTKCCMTHFFDTDRPGTVTPLRGNDKDDYAVGTPLTSENVTLPRPTTANASRPGNPRRLDHKGTGVKVTSIYVTITHTVSTTRAMVSRPLRYIRYIRISNSGQWSVLADISLCSFVS